MNKMISIECMEKIAKENLVLYISNLDESIKLLLKNFDDEDELEYDDPNMSTINNKIYRVINLFEDKSIRIIGNSDDYHNLSVTLARHNLYDCACRVLNRGIQERSGSIDLLADYIKYGICCGEYIKCDEMCEKLKNISYHEWNWRAFSFLIDFLLDKKERHPELSKEIRRELLQWANRFIAKENNDQSYFDKSSIYRAYGDKYNEIATLTEGIKLSRSQKCSLRLAEIEFEMGNYTNAIEHISKCWKTFGVQPEVNKSYTFLLLGLSETSKFLNEVDNFEKLDDNAESALKGIYKNFDSALKTGNNDIYIDTAKTVISILESQTGITYPYNNEPDAFDF